jgi:hypothetical protein
MESEAPRRTLIVANRTAATEVLAQEVSDRATERPTEFTLLIPAIRTKQLDWTLDEALKSLRRAASGPHGLLTPHVEGRTGGKDVFESVKEALAEGQFDDVIISTLPQRTSEWLRRDLPRRVEALGVPVKVITPLTDKRGTFGQFVTYVQPGRRDE